VNTHNLKHTVEAVATAPRSRRDILKKMGLGLALPAAASVLAACGNAAPATAPAPAPAATAHTDASHAAPAATAAANAWEEMDRMHEAGIKAFPAKTEGLGGQVLEPRLDGNVKVYELTCKKVMWEVSPGKKLEAWTYNGQLPGPEIRVTQGDTVRIIVKNELDESTAVHFHGVRMPNKMDGVPFITQPPIRPGESFTYEFVVPNAGSHMYHSHHNSTKQVSMGMLGAFIVDPKDKGKEPKFDKDYTVILNDTAHGYTWNGKGFPATAPLTAKLGEKVRIRFMNEGMMIHPMHLHGLAFLVVAKDGYPQPVPWECDTLNVAPGERWDVIVDCDNPGIWAFHCHILQHAESEHGMFGMVNALIVEE
jgi:FtsP/CotA-like multicopper oxidase with cupredoxin domain